MSTANETILLIERKDSRDQTFAVALDQKGYKVEVVSTGYLALERAKVLRPEIIVLNAASLGSSGVRICQRLNEEIYGVPIIHILGSEEHAKELRNGLADATLVMPFTPRKLINRIKRLLPGARKDAIEVGPIRLVPGVRIVEAHGRERRLTPKTANLLETFLKSPGQTLDRGFLMRKVWNTNYMGDTRTLDVHVRWAREAIEPDPDSPVHIVTVRGIGYRFEPYPQVEETD